MKLLASFLVTLLFVAFATCQAAPDTNLNADTLEKDSTEAAPKFTWEIPSLHYVFASDRDIPYVTTPSPIDEESNVLKKEESEVSKNINVVEQEDGLHELKDINEDTMQNFGDVGEGHDINLKLKLRLKDSHGTSEGEESEKEGEESEKEGEAKEEGSQAEFEENLEKSKPGKMKSKKVKSIEERYLREQPLKVNPLTEFMRHEGVTGERSGISPRTIRSPLYPISRTRFSGYPLRRGYMSEAPQKPFGDTGAPSLDLLYAKLTITHKMLKALDDYMVGLENEKLVDTTRGSPQLAKRLELITELSHRLHNFMLGKIEKMNSQIDALKQQSSAEHLGALRSSPMGVRRGVQGLQGVRGVQGIQGIEGIQGEQNRFI